MAQGQNKAMRISIGILLMTGFVMILFGLITRYAGTWGVPYFSFTSDRGSPCTNRLTGYTCDPLTLADVQSGAFAKRFIDDQDAGAPEFKELRKKGEEHPIEATGHQLRGLMAWVKSHDDDYVEGHAAR